MGGRSRTTAETTSIQDIDTTNVGLQDIGGIGIAGGGDVVANIEVTDLGAVQGAFDFAGDFGDGAFMFANDVARQAGELSERAIETSQQAVATLATGGQSDIARIDQKSIAIAAAALVAVLVLPQVFRRAS